MTTRNSQFTPRRVRKLAGALVVAAALIAPASALAAGTVSTNSAGDVTYNGSAGADEVTVSSTDQGFPKATVVISGPGVTEGTDTANICTATTDAVSCDFDIFDDLFVNGGDGADKITSNGDAVPASIDGGDGPDELIGSDLPEGIVGGGQSDTIDGRGGGDALTGQQGADVVMGGEGADSSVYDDGDGDQIDLGPGSDAIYTSNTDGKDDVLRGGDGNDILLFTTLGGTGDKPFSTIDLSKGVYSWDAFDMYPAGQDSLDGIEDVGALQSGLGNDIIVGDAHSNVLAGGVGEDTITGGLGTDTIYGDGSFLGPTYFFSYGTDPDTIDAFDGFEDHVDCGGGTDTLTSDQFDSGVTSGCETVDSRQANPFGIEPQPEPQPEPKPQPDVAAPKCTTPKAAAKKRRAVVRRGFSLTVTCDEQARLGVSSRARGLVLDARSFDFGSGGRKVAVKVPRALRGSLGKRFTVRVRIDATDRAGNRSTSFATIKVR